MKELIQNLFRSIEAKQKLILDTEQLKAFSNAVGVVTNCIEYGGTLYIAGNGGSAADAQHLAAEFVSKLAKPRDPLPAEALTTDTSIITAIGNDFGFEEIFSRQLQSKVDIENEAIFLAITTSGNSPNILKALETCRERRITSIVFSGRDGGKAKELADICVIAPGETTSTIQEVHEVLYHTLCECVEAAIFPEIDKKTAEFQELCKKTLGDRGMFTVEGK